MLTKQPNLIAKLIIIILSSLFISACEDNSFISRPLLVEPTKPITLSHDIAGSFLKKVTINLNNPKNYANISMYSGDTLLIDNLNVPTTGNQVVNALVQFNALGKVNLTIKTTNAALTINSLTFEDVEDLTLPVFKDISVPAGLDKESSIKYGGPTIADIDNDGDYDFIVNNHNGEASKLYWNNGNGTVTKHNKDLSRWFMHDLHGTAAGDYDNDGDLDLIVTMGGGNGTAPSKANFYKNSNGKLILHTGDVNIDRGGRGRGAKWSDMDLDGDLDLMLINEASLTHSKPQHFFYKNMADGTFEYTPIAGLEDQEPSRALITDLNNDNIDDVILYSPLSVWQGNGDFTFTDITSQFPTDIANFNTVMAITDIDIDNDGDLDLYLARGKMFEHGFGEAPSVDHDPITKEFSIKPRGYKGVDKFEFISDNTIKFHQYNFLTQGSFRGKDYPLFLGSEKSAKVLAIGEELEITPESAQGWPNDFSANGVYFGFIGNEPDGTKRWKAALVRDGDIFWTFKFSLSGVNDVTLGFEPENRNIADVLLRNDNGTFVEVSKEWNIPSGGNALGVTVGDFNNDSHQDLFVYRWGKIDARISDYMLINTGKGTFETVTMHGANDVGGPGNGDMGQAFDFDLDGDLDLLNGSEDGEWYLYENQTTQTKGITNNSALVRVGYAPKSNVDAISAEVIVTTPSKTYRKRVGSAGAVFSQSLLNIVHFGLGKEEVINRIQVRWRNGETVVLEHKKANQLFDTNNVDPTSIAITPAISEIREGTTITLSADIAPINANKQINWASSDSSIISVDQQGSITATGSVNQSAIISAKTVQGDAFTNQAISIVKWVEQPIQSVKISAKNTTLIAGDVLQLNAALTPQHADNARLTWSSSNENIATVNSNGTVTTIGAGVVDIIATSQSSAQSNKQINDNIELTISPLIEPYIQIINEEKLQNSAFVVGESITLKVNYHAGSGNTVISADEGGIRYWLREFKYKWIPAKDITQIDASALKTESGESTMTFSLEGLTPSAELPEGHFYYLNASFASSNGDIVNHAIYPINIVAQYKGK